MFTLKAADHHLNISLSQPSSKNFLQQFSHNVIPRRNLVSGQFWQTAPRSLCLLSTDRLSRPAPQASPGAPHGGGLPAGPGLVPVGPASAVRSVLLTEAIVRSQIAISVVWHRSPGARAKHFLSGLWVDEGTGLGRLLDSEGQRSLRQGIRAMRPRPQCPFPSPAAKSRGSLVCGLDFFQTAVGEPESQTEMTSAKLIPTIMVIKKRD